ncbi:hypothetical protein B9T31_10910 [Acinetobacter sp. ANC 4558]|uniref:hypothetical protein n=1 Tax=Acinetobacter sp. ANC 4558 TaxID=1977876 RepID=UPI000A3322A7|nr:hypothetical protein [Acinetobacter sp. ANC 4558]OTG85663.1 hypothetical protein B9T31_10910 [Acinetobacter sp. ANC 4558]
MTKSVYKIGIFSLVVSVLTGCQVWDTARIKNVKETESTQQNALVFCTGTETCEFERLDLIKIVDENRHQIGHEAIEQGVVRLKGTSLNKPNTLYLSVSPQQHEIVIRFYPISKERAEKLFVIHKFEAKRNYTFKMYRNRGVGTGSLLNVSAPEPLCVDLIEGQKTIRRFCKPYNVLNGLGEFVEMKLNKRQ